MSIKKYATTEWVGFLNHFLPNGEAFVSKYVEGTNLRAYQKAKSQEFKRFGDFISDLISEVIPSTSINLLSEWESYLGIPDNCIPLATTLQERRDNVILKLTSLAYQTEQHLVDLADAYGFTITFSLSTGFNYTLPFVLNNSERSLFLIKGNFSTNPEKAAVFQCLIRSLIPANKTVGFQESLVIPF